MMGINREPNLGGLAIYRQSIGIKRDHLRKDLKVQII